MRISANKCPVHGQEHGYTLLAEDEETHAHCQISGCEYKTPTSNWTKYICPNEHPNGPIELVHNRIRTKHNCPLLFCDYEITFNAAQTHTVVQDEPAKKAVVVPNKRPMAPAVKPNYARPAPKPEPKPKKQDEIHPMSAGDVLSKKVKKAAQQRGGKAK